MGAPLLLWQLTVQRLAAEVQPLGLFQRDNPVYAVPAGHGSAATRGSCGRARGAHTLTNAAAECSGGCTNSDFSQQAPQWCATTLMAVSQLPLLGHRNCLSARRLLGV